MTEIPTPEHLSAPESQALQQLGATVERVFNNRGDDGFRTTPREYNRPGFDGVEDVVASEAGVVLRRFTSEDGTVDYSASKNIWANSGDRGWTETRWQKGGVTATEVAVSELQGDMHEQPAGLEAVTKVQAEIEAAFFPKAAEPAIVATRGLSRFFKKRQK